MDKRLKEIGKQMRSNNLIKLSFSERSKELVRKQMQQERVLKEMLPLLIEEKSGAALCKLLLAKGEPVIEMNEGMVYTILHEAEHNGFVVSRWYDTGEKVYKLTKAGLKQIATVEERRSVFDLKGLWQEVRSV